MSITKKKFSLLLTVCAEILLCLFASQAQNVKVDIKIASLSPPFARVEGRFLSEKNAQTSKNWSFINSFAGAENLSARISDFNLSDKNKRPVALKKFADGEYVGDGETAFWNYQINLSSLPNESAMAHVSWISGEQGILMLGDLLPQFAGENNQAISARVKFELPEDWKIISNEKHFGANDFYVANVEKAIFFVGKNLREKEISVGKTRLNFTSSDEWRFSAWEASEMAGEIFEEYRKLFGDAPAEKAQIFLVHFPKEIKFGRWEAETRGGNVTIVSSDMPFKTLSLQRLHEQFRHEIFHLWIPNNLALTGNYDWFYEGFAVYQSLKISVRTNQIRFEDFLDTLAQAYNFSNSQTGKISLVEDSKNRWRGAAGNSPVYSRGMIAAFLCDIALLRESRGNRQISDLLKEIYSKHRAPGELQDGNAAVIKILESYKELRPVVEKYIKGTDAADWRVDLENVGIEVSETNSFIKLAVKSKLKDRQKDLLNNLGYNNWHKPIKKAQ